MEIIKNLDEVLPLTEEEINILEQNPDNNKLKLKAQAYSYRKKAEELKEKGNRFYGMHTIWAIQTANLSNEI